MEMFDDFFVQNAEMTFGIYATSSAMMANNSDVSIGEIFKRALLVVIVSYNYDIDREQVQLESHEIQKSFYE